MSNLDLDASRWPLLRISFRGRASAERIDELFGRLDACLAGYERFAVLIDARRGAVPTTARRRRIAAWIGDNEEMLQGLVTGVAFVVTSPLVRLGVTAILSLQTLPTPYRVFVRERPARGWLTDKLRLGGAAIPTEEDPLARWRSSLRRVLGPDSPRGRPGLLGHDPEPREHRTQTSDG